MLGPSTRTSEAPAIVERNAVPARREGAVRRIGRGLVATALQHRAAATLRRRLGHEWRVLDQHCLAVDDGECLVDHILLHADMGVMLVLVDRGIYAAPDIAIEVMQRVLRQVGFGNRFRGYLPVNCVAVERAPLPDMPAQRKVVCAVAAPVEIREPGWSEWLQEALSPYRLAAAERRAPWRGAPGEEQGPYRRGGASLGGLGLRDAIVATATILVFGSGVAVGAIMLGTPREARVAPSPAPSAVSYVVPAALPVGAGSGAEAAPEEARLTPAAAMLEAPLPPLPRAKPNFPLPQAGEGDAQASAIQSPATTRAAPAVRETVRPKGSTFSARTAAAIAAIQSTFMTPPTKTSAISAQQQPMQ
jgi:hypothetical protein